MARPRVTEHKEVLDAAARMLAEQGIAATTVDDVAEAAGVSRATVYRYLGGKDEIVAGVISRETRHLLGEIEGLIPNAANPRELIQSIVITAVEVVESSAVLSRLNNEDRRETLPFITVGGAPLIELVVDSLGPVLRDNVSFGVDFGALDTVLEEATRLVLSHLTTPRTDGNRLEPVELGDRVATMVVPLLDPDGQQ